MSSPPQTPRRSALRRLTHPIEGNPDIFSSEGSFAPAIGARVGEPEHPRGYHIDFADKAKQPRWPPEWLPALDERLHVSTIQWALGAFERYVAGEGEAWRQAALNATEQLLATQIREGTRAGAWLQWQPMPHTYRIDPPWVSSIAQGEAASLLVRLHAETGEERFAEAGRRALLPMRKPTAAGGVLVGSDAQPFFEEYPSMPPSRVLNGAIFALWGFHDVGRALGDTDALEWFEAGVDTLAAMIDRYDTGRWSLYDLYPHPLANIASAAYHLLHINQLTILERLSPRPELSAARARFESYRSSPRLRRRATARKIAFRLLTPRNRLLAQRLPWNESVRRRHGGGRLVVLCYHAISDSWKSTLTVTPALLRDQIAPLLAAGYEPTTFTQGVLGQRAERSLAVTFDDSYASVAELAKPVLDELGVPATVFVPTRFAGRAEPMSWPGIERFARGPNRDELRPMSWEQLTELAGSGWEVGSHTATHARLPQLDDERALAELRESRQECERRLGRPCLALAYPYGALDRRTVRLAARAGYATAAALPPPFAPETTLAWPRIGAYAVDRRWRMRLKLSRQVRWLRRSRLGPLLGRAAHGFSNPKKQS